MLLQLPGGFRLGVVAYSADGPRLAGSAAPRPAIGFGLGQSYMLPLAAGRPAFELLSPASSERWGFGHAPLRCPTARNAVLVTERMLIGPAALQSAACYLRAELASTRHRLLAGYAATAEPAATDAGLENGLETVPLPRAQSIIAVNTQTIAPDLAV